MERAPRSLSSSSPADALFFILFSSVFCFRREPNEISLAVLERKCKSLPFYSLFKTKERERDERREILKLLNLFFFFLLLSFTPGFEATEPYARWGFARVFFPPFLFSLPSGDLQPRRPGTYYNM